MGGNALRNKGASRVTTLELFKVRDVVRNQLVEYFSKGMIGFPHFVRHKETHGDVDVVVASSLKSTIRERFGVVEGNENVFMSKGCDCVLFEVPNTDKMVQVDFIYVPDNAIDYGIQYYSWNDLSNLIGKTARRLGLKHCFDGLFRPVRDDKGHLVGKILITCDFNHALELLGYDSFRYARGFNTLEEVFEYVISSIHFSMDSQRLENMNHRDRVRERKRNTHKRFIEWCDAGNVGFAVRDDEAIQKQRSFIESLIPDIFEKEQRIIEQYKTTHRYREVRITDVISNTLDVRGRDMAYLIQALIKKHKNWHEYAVTTDIQIVLEECREILREREV